MRIATTLVAVVVLLGCSVASRAETVEFTDKASFSLLPAAGYQREIVVVFPAPFGEAFVRPRMPGLTGTSIVELSDCLRGLRPMSQDEPAVPADADADALRRRKLTAAFEAGVKGLMARGASERKFVRVTALAFEGSATDAMILYSAGKIDCDQLIIVDPVIDELPAITAARRSRAVDAVLPSRSEGEAARRFDELKQKLGPWFDTARIFTGSGEWDVVRTLALFRGYQLHKVREGGAASGGVPLSGILELCGQADVVIVGELHGNPGAHALQRDVLELLQANVRVPLALSTEQWERDTQAALDAFMAMAAPKAADGDWAKAEQAFMKDSRAWPNYADYRPLLEFARANKLPVIAGNVPRPLAARINKEGPAAFEAFNDDENKWSARKLNAPDGAYKDKFFEVMGTSTGAKKDEKYAAMERMYAAQCLKDDTMAESIVDWLAKNRGGKVLHINGAFHSANGLGVPQKLLALRPELKVVVITCVEADNPFTAEVDAADAGGNHFVALVPSSRPNRKSGGPSHPK